jgi:hypothetical protein
MSLLLVEADSMARRSKKVDPIGPVIAENLWRLGWAVIRPKGAELSKLVAERTGRSMSKQRISAIVNAVHVEPETIATLAQAIGVDPDELTRR